MSFNLPDNIQAINIRFSRRRSGSGAQLLDILDRGGVFAPAGLVPSGGASF